MHAQQKQFDNDVCHVGLLCIHHNCELSKQYFGMLWTAYRKRLPMLQAATIK